MARVGSKPFVGHGAATLVMLIAGLSLLRFIGWTYPFELFSHLQVQYFLGAVGCGVVLAVLGRWRWLPVAAACLVLTGSAIVPYGLTPGSSARASAGATGGTLRVLAANVLRPNRAHGRVLDLVDRMDADVLLFQEVNDRWIEALTPLMERYPHTLCGPADDGFRMIVFSRLPFDETAIVMLGSAGRPTYRLTVTVGGVAVSIVCTHPRQPLPPGNLGLRNGQLVEVGEYCGSLEGPVILVGDLNTTMWSPWFRRLIAESGLTCPRRGRGVLATWPAYLPAPLRVPIDHFLVSDDLVVTGLRVGPKIGSDHLPLIIDVAID